MASTFGLSTVLLLISLINCVVITAVPEREYNTMLAALRIRGYHLFANAIATTDLHYDILYGSNFTFFAPVDSALYALDMSMSASNYLTTLRFHVVPHRLSLPDLRMLPYGSNSFPTLVPGHDVHLVNRLPLPLPITVEGVDIAVPGLFYDTHISVHGLDGIIGFRFPTGNSPSDITGNITSNVTNDHTFQSTMTNVTNDHSPMTVHGQAYAPSPHPPFNSTRNHTIAVPAAAPPPLSSNLTENHTVKSPVASPETSIMSSSDISPETHRTSIPLAPWHHQQESYSISTTHKREEHMSTETTPELISKNMYDVSLAMKSTSNYKAGDEFTRVDDKIIDCPFRDYGGEQLNIANIRHGYLYTRELYTPSNMSCAQE